MSFELILFYITFAIIVVFVIWSIIEKTGGVGPFDGGKFDVDSE